MKKNLILSVLVIALTLAFSTGFVNAFADQENEFDIPHNHELTVTSFNNGEVTYTCAICEDSFVDYFENHINESGYEPLDVVDDGIINAKDFAYLSRNY